MLAAFIYNTSGKAFKNTIKADDLIPDYLGSRKGKPAAKSLEQQEAEFKTFHAELKAKTEAVIPKRK